MCEAVTLTTVSHEYQGGKSRIKDLGKQKKKITSELPTTKFSQQHSEVRAEKQTEQSLKGAVHC